MKASKPWKSFLLLLVLPLACGKHQSVHERSSSQIFKTTFSTSAVELKKKDCGSGSSENEFIFNLQMFFQGRFADTTENYSFLFEQREIRTPFISDVFWKESVEIAFIGRKAEINQLSAKEVFKSCIGQQTFERDSVDAAALSTAKYIHEAGNKFQRLFPEIFLGPVSISIAPLILRSEIQKDDQGRNIKETEILTDNAFYEPTGARIVMLPHSKFRSLSMPNFWEVPMVPTHEYGHHLFQAIYQGKKANRSGYHHSCFSSITGQENKNLRKVTYEDVLNAFNEGFADLVAFYLLSPRERSVKGVRCLEVSRDVESPTFYNGRTKVFTREGLRAFTSEFPAFSLSCENPGPQELHTLGAMFAWSADHYLSLFTNSDEEKLAAVVEWVKFLSLERRRLAALAPEVYLRTTLTQFVRMSAARFNQNFDSRICGRVDKIFPVILLSECRRDI